MGQKAKNAGKKKSKQFAPKLANVSSVQLRGGRMRNITSTRLDLGPLTTQQREEVMGILGDGAGGGMFVKGDGMRQGVRYVRYVQDGANVSNE